jgi:phosphatidylglycerol:prolipoprotein diacylglycerol transferase
VLGTAAAAGLVIGLPFFEVTSLGPIQGFGVIVAIGVLVGATIMRRYGDRFGVDDDDMRAVIGWVAVTGFIGAHEFDMIAYQWHEIGNAAHVVPPSWWFLPDGMYPSNWPLPLKFWQGISSYGGFLGGALGFMWVVWRRRLTPGLWADATAIGLLVAFSIGRIACTLVHDHVGAATDFALGTDYPRAELVARGLEDGFAAIPAAVKTIRAHNLGLYELLYLIPVNAIVLWLAFKAKRRPAGFITVVTGALYAPVRFFLEFLRLDQSDPRYAGLTFAQWCSIAAFTIACVAAVHIWRKGQVAPLKDELDGKVGGSKVSIAAAKANEAARKKKDADKSKGGGAKAKSKD